ncbi:hypothetical protein EXIGLDRAFT_749674 [Exidia glandulosa HHB12029]|uniref:BTB domain-containing protein n=1 Tax=Exidia glandulosa HHB12029 TaxID=1314781 RepID=A0A165HTW6_EXIGL|nr:hypothetical protein EXIGLDRAFT_749674 [Exidia glandulosa HHB12029]
MGGDACTNSEQWWFNDGSIVLQAGNTLFKLHLSILARASAFFKDFEESRDRPTWPKTSRNAIGEGTEVRPLVLRDVAGYVFTDLLHVLHLKWGEPLTLSTARLVDVLRAAHRYQFPFVCQVAESQLREKMEPVAELQVARSMGSVEWASIAFRNLVLPFDDAANLFLLDWPVKAKILKARQRVRDLRLQHLVVASGELVVYMHAPPHCAAGTKENIPQICPRHLRHLLQFVPTTKRQQFSASFLSAKMPDVAHHGPPFVTPQSDGFPCCACMFGEADVLGKVAGPVAEEYCIVEDVWKE